MNKSRETVKVKVLLGYLFLVVIASFTVWLIYTEVVRFSSEKTRLNPLDKKVLLINSILTNLYQAEGFERTYLQTGGYDYYAAYELVMDTIYQQIDTLISLSSTSTQRTHADSIHMLFDRKRKNLQELAAIRNSGSADEIYRTAMQRLMHDRDSINHRLQVYKTITTNRDSIYVMQKKQNFLNRLVHVFSSQDNKDSTLQVKVRQSVSFDSLLNTFNPADSVMQYLSAVMENLQEKNNETKRLVTEKESEVLANNLTISSQLHQMLTLFKNEEITASFNEMKIIQGRLRQTTLYMILLGILAIVAIIVFLTLILKDITKSRHYRDKLEQARAYSEALLKSKERFMLSITHDIKSPLGSVIGYARLMYKEPDSRQKDYYLENINKSAEHILKLINDLVDLSKLETGKLKIQYTWFNLKELIDETYSGFYPIALTKNLEFRLEFDISSALTYHSDPVRIKQIIVNIISNAIKFTSKGEVKLKVFITESFGTTDRISFEVSDTGLGISESDKFKIFDEFSRVASKDNRQYEGVGLGLAITQRIVSLLNGTITLVSLPGKGSRFTVTLPLEKYISPQKDVEIPLSKPGTEITGKTVLLIDDDEAFLDMISETLKKTGIKVYKHHSPAQALKFLENTHIDLIMTDIHMPGISGTDLLRHVQNDTSHEIPVIAITGGDASGEEDYLKLGFAACIYKPFQSDRLLKIVRNILSGNSPDMPVDSHFPENTVSYSVSYNLNQVKKFAEDDMESVHRILTSLVEGGSKNILLFRKYLDEKDYPSLFELIHKMISIFRQIEASEITAILGKIQSMADKPLADKQINLLGREALGMIEELIERICKEQNISLKA